MKIWDIKPPLWWSTKQMRLQYNRRLIRKFFNGLQTRDAIDGDRAILLLYNEQSPELSYIITERL